jgi:NADPH:quinone reductase-like Zn-dependent oxidoreductase
MRAVRITGAGRPLQLMNHNRSVSGVNIGRPWSEIAILRQEFQAVLELWAAGRTEPRIDQSYPFAEAAHHRILQRQNTGKIVLIP